LSTIDRFDGWVDGRLRPLINVRFWRDKTVCALVDTGFNGHLLWEATEAELSEFPGELSGLYESVEVAGGRVLAGLGWTSIQWLGEEGVFIGVETFIALSDKRRKPGDPVALLGTALLTGTTLAVDFSSGTLRIQRSMT
jgi:predicted aspartyl protease